MSDDADIKEIIAIFKGRVQGVGFRATIRRYALHFQLVGTVRNLNDGSVELVAQGDNETLQALIEAIKMRPRGARILSCDLTSRSPTELFQAFKILH